MRCLQRNMEVWSIQLSNRLVFAHTTALRWCMLVHSIHVDLKTADERRVVFLSNKKYKSFAEAHVHFYQSLLNMENLVVAAGSTATSRGKFYSALVASVTGVQLDDAATRNLLIWQSKRHYESILFAEDKMRDLEHQANGVIAKHSPRILKLLNDMTPLGFKYLLLEILSSKHSNESVYNRVMSLSLEL
eukprot:GHVR01156993.1.p1 GENE.GHVR01156993.1~~GHVR01156993.1.p1  ORF type:complete len:189 (+),score=13.02 GHVR01156993.1:1227-1793(+)